MTDRNHVIEQFAAGGVLEALKGSESGRQLIREIDAYRIEYGNRPTYTHEYTSTTWREDPTSIVEALRRYLSQDHDYEKDVRQLHANRDRHQHKFALERNPRLPHIRESERVAPKGQVGVVKAGVPTQ